MKWEEGHRDTDKLIPLNKKKFMWQKEDNSLLMRKQLMTTGFTASKCGYSWLRCRTAADTWGQSIWNENVRLHLHEARPTQAKL